MQNITSDPGLPITRTNIGNIAIINVFNYVSEIINMIYNNINI